ncbi:MAG: GNAT family protein [Anaerolineae bacterium]|jgi:RimJ/RimL family protein N-acetyltransferase|nr:GNAT family protein [Anaerolineae bacterium]
MTLNRFQYTLPSRLDAERIYLRPYQAGDGSMYFTASLRNKEHLSTFEFDNVLCHLKDEAHAELVVRDLHADWVSRQHFFWGIFENETDVWCGQVYVGPTNWELPEFSIGYVADVQFEGKGYISEAVKRVLRSLFEDLHAVRIVSDCHENNVRSWKLLERCGFNREGHLRQNRKNPDGTFHGDYLYGLLRDDFENGTEIKSQP